MAKLTRKQELFVAYYLENNYNGTMAYKKAYGVSDEKLAAARASYLIRLESVKKAIDEGLLQAKDKIRITKNQIIDILIDITHSAKTGHMSTAIKALELIAKIEGFNAPTRNQTDITSGGERININLGLDTPDDTKEQLND